jgi:uncharacterized protein YciI
MYAIALIRYRKPVEEVVLHQDPHRAYLRELKAKGILIAAGPCNPRFGGILLLRVVDEDAKALDTIRDADPFVQNGVAQYELLGWNPVIGKEDLDKI